MTLRIDNLRLWDGRNDVLSDASLLIEDGLIAGIAPTSEVGLFLKTPSTSMATASWQSQAW